MNLVAPDNNVTEQVTAKQLILENEERFRLLATTIPQIVWTTRVDGSIDHLSDQWELYTGKKARESLNNWEQFVHPDDLPTVLKKWQASMRTGLAWNSEYRLKNEITGEYRWFVGNCKPLIDDKHHVVKWVGAATDIQSLKEQSQLLEQQVKERTKELEHSNISLQQSNEDLQQFAHVASHDLKEPLRKINTFGSRLQDEFEDLLPENGKTYLAKIHSSANRMFSMIEGVLMYSMFNASEKVANPVDLNLIVQNIEADLEIIIREKNAKIRYDDLPTIEGSQVLLYQLFYNLINNSLKFSRRENPPFITLKSTIRTDGKIPLVEIIVKDNGIGFEQAYAEKIFNTFTRLHSKDKFEGTGLGLSLCKKIVQRHKGTITAKGSDEGAEFLIMIPLKQDQKLI